MKTDHSMWASFMLTATTRDKMTWANSRSSDLQRHLSAVKKAVERQLDGDADISELSEEVDRMIARLEFVRESCQALQDMRANGGHAPPISGPE